MRTARTQTITVGRSCLAVVVAVSGCATFLDADGEIVRDRAVMILARSGSRIAFWSADAVGIVLHVSRPRIQALTSALLSRPVRIPAIDARIFGDAVLLGMLADIAGAASRGDWSEDDHAAWCRRIESELASRFSGEPDWTALLGAPRAIEHAVAAIRAGAEMDLDPVALASGAGVTLRTLRTGFANCFGIPLATYMQNARLQKAFERLASGYDSRAMGEVARGAGFRSTPNFSRAYRRRFCETPTQTRARAVRSAPTANTKG